MEVATQRKILWKQRNSWNSVYHLKGIQKMDLFTPQR